MTAVFITASGTELGKTFVSSALCRQLRAKGQSVRALKPVISGFNEQTAPESDTYQLIAAMGETPEPSLVDSVSPWRFKEAVSPDMAASREGRSIPFKKLVAHSRTAIEAHEGPLLIEGVGGVMVPLDDKHTVLDWMTALKLPCLLVVGSYLGSLSHALTAAKTLETAGVPLAGVVVSESEDCPVPVEESAETLRRFLPGVTVTIVPRQKGKIDWSAIPDLTGLLDGLNKDLS